MAETKRIMYQYGCLPFKHTPNGGLSILLVTSRGSGRWIVPKGRPERGRKAWQVAAQEAYEEAGVLGFVSTKAIGAYQSVKRLRSGLEVACTVRVFLFEVEEELDDWPERGQRERRWAAPADALALVSEPNLVAVLREFAESWD